MTDQELNRRVAELAGWSTHPNDRFVWVHKDSPNSVWPYSAVPNYTTSRDAIIGLVERLSKHNRWKIADTIARRTTIADMITIPARDLCEAYVKVMGGCGMTREQSDIRRDALEMVTGARKVNHILPRAFCVAKPAMCCAVFAVPPCDREPPVAHELFVSVYGDSARSVQHGDWCSLAYVSTAMSGEMRVVRVLH